MKKKEYCSLGIMSGTSIDGLDFSLIKTDGKSNIKNLINDYFKFNDNFKESIKKFIKKFNQQNYKLVLESAEFKKFNQTFTDFLYKKIKIFLRKNNQYSKKIDVIGIHGNTLIHKPDEGFSIQLGDGILLSQKLKTTIVSNFRTNDIKQQGQGAPLVPIFHQRKFAKKKKKIMVINIGGISNFTFLIGKRKILASDLGPGNKLIDEFCSKQFRVNYDNYGKLSSRGKVDDQLIIKWSKKNFLNQSFPKSFDNAFFKLNDFVVRNNKNKYDLLRTLTYFTAFLMLNLKLKISCKIDKWIFSGGGVKNKTLMRDINKLLGNEIVLTSQDYKLNPFFIESQAFAYISVRTLKKLPSTYPNTTGCKKSTISGVIHNPD